MYKQRLKVEGFDSHAEEDGEGVANQPGNPKTKQGQTLLPTANAFNEIQWIMSNPTIVIEFVKKKKRYQNKEKQEDNQEQKIHKNGCNRTTQTHISVQEKISTIQASATDANDEPEEYSDENHEG